MCAQLPVKRCYLPGLLALAWPAIGALHARLGGVLPGGELGGWGAAGSSWGARGAARGARIWVQGGLRVHRRRQPIWVRVEADSPLQEGWASGPSTRLARATNKAAADGHFHCKNGYRGSWAAPGAQGVCWGAGGLRTTRCRLNLVATGEAGTGPRSS